MRTKAMPRFAGRDRNVEVLLIEDNPTDVLLLENELKSVASTDLQLTSVDRLGVGLQRLRERRFDVALVDLALPDSEGIETFDRLREAEPDLPAIVVTGSRDERLAVEVLRKGARDYVVKAIGVGPLLIRAIRFAIERQLILAESAVYARHLEQSEGQIRGLIDASADAVVVVDFEGLVRLANPSAESMFGRQAADLISHSFGFPVVKGQTAEVDIVRSDGTTGVAEMRVVETVWGDAPAFLASLRDITAHKLAQEAIQQLNSELEQRTVQLAQANVALQDQSQRLLEMSQAKSDFLARMSHDVRTPLNAIIGFSELLQDGKLGPVTEAQREYLGDVLTSAQHLLHLINDVLDLSKVEAGKMVFHPRNVELADLVHEVAASLRPLFGEKRLGLAIEIHESLRSVAIDPARLKQVLYNLLSNSIKFTPHEGHVALRVQPEGSDAFRLEVEDNGIGIREEDLGKLFVEFQQVHSTTAQQPGTGLGLSITKRIVEAQGGKVGVHSRYGKGSVFFAVLPRSADQASHPGTVQSRLGTALRVEG
jgi:signal transduction histidine kinase